MKIAEARLIVCSPDRNFVGIQEPMAHTRLRTGSTVGTVSLEGTCIREMLPDWQR